MVQADRPLPLLLNLVRGPPRGELRAHLLQTTDQRGKCGIAHLRSGRLAKQREYRARVALPIVRDAAQVEIGEVVPDDVALVRREGAPRRDQRFRTIPG